MAGLRVRFRDRPPGRQSPRRRRPARPVRQRHPLPVAVLTASGPEVPRRAMLRPPAAGTKTVRRSTGRAGSIGNRGGPAEPPPSGSSHNPHRSSDEGLAVLVREFAPLDADPVALGDAMAALGTPVE